MNKLTGFTVPTFEALRGQSGSHYEARLGQGVTLGQGPVAVMPYIDGMLANGAYGYLDHIASQTMVLWATGENLDGHGFTFDVKRIQASRATGNVIFSGVAGAGIDANQVLRDSAGVEFKVIDGVVLDEAGQAVANVKASVPGANGNLLEGASLTLVNPVDGVDPVATVAAGGFAGGADKEKDGRPGVIEHYRERILKEISMPPHGGAGGDYEKWAKEVPGVTRVWVARREMGMGTVTVRFMMDVLRASDGGIPTAADVALVQSHIDARRPTTADVYVVAPIPKSLAITIMGLDPDTPAVRSSITAELLDMIFRRGQPGVTLSRSWITEAIAISAGEGRHKVTAPADDVVHAIGEIPVLGVVSYD
ncbi:MAG: baseplate J/gp47 family protein [Rhodospirillales bacterium]|nr:baseplate J/gp47 family protein [Rhodospirillales bacterium]MBR9816890.1 baseplate J/gp47 family protein [Rhodospirillales bacterium]